MGDVGCGTTSGLLVDLKVASDRNETSLESVAALTDSHLADDSRAIFEIICLWTDYCGMPGGGKHCRCIVAQVSRATTLQQLLLLFEFFVLGFLYCKPFPVVIAVVPRFMSRSMHVEGFDVEGQEDAEGTQVSINQSIKLHLFQPHQADQMPGCHWTSQLHKRTSCLNMHE